MHPFEPALSIRTNPDNPDHHLWCNHGVWWIHYVVHEGNHKRRIRSSLGTKDLTAARQRRDALFAGLPKSKDVARLREGRVA